MKKDVLVMFGGVSPEHEVSIITGLQVLEKMDRSIYAPHAVYVNKSGEILYLGDIPSRKKFEGNKGRSCSFGRNHKGGYLQIQGFRGEKVYPYSAYLAFHGGLGEGGGMQGLLESLNIPHTSTTQESSVIVMNKQLTKDQVGSKGIGVVPGLSFLSTEIQDSSEKISSAIQNELGLPVIIKPVHLGSSIGIKVAKTDIELEKYLLEAAFIDREVLVEKYLTGFVEYNCAVRFVNGEFETSEIEKPLSNDEILSFTDKYERGGKKTGGDGGMASLIRELPAKIDASLKQEIQSTAIEAFTACRCKGMVRIDFMYTSDNQLLLTEVNPIPGSMAYYLWEASGIPFKQQITDLIEQSVLDQQKGSSMELDYKSDIVEKFIT